MIEDARNRINGIDRKLAELFEQRMQAAKEIAEYKLQHSLPIEDSDREQSLISRDAEYVSNPEIRAYFVDFLQHMISLSKQYQAGVISQIKGTDDCKRIVIERGALNRIEELIPMTGKILVLTDSGVPQQYSRTIASKAGMAFIYTIEQGEQSKNIDNWCKILEFMKGHSFTRTDAVVAVGGGVVGDLAGFVASAYMRGIRFYNIPTTLLSQVDSSIGGKTAVDFFGVKNMVGAFYQPHKVIIDTDTLKTLPERQLHSGLVESIKMAATFDKCLFELIENSTDLEKDLDEIIRQSLKIKGNVVCQDPLEKGLRRVLNFGHTVGHAIETLGKGKYLHGEAVGMGMLYFSAPDVRVRIKRLLDKYNLPTECAYSADELKELIRLDKKAMSDNIRIIRVNTIGEYEICQCSIDSLEI